jgi:flagellin
MTVINTNIAASITATAMKSNARAMENTMERLATGTRVNSASDDAAGLAIGSKMTAQVKGLQQAARNANDAISLVQTADGAAIEIGDMLQRMRELAVQAANGTNDTDDIANLNKEFASLATEIDRVADSTEFNGIQVLKGDILNDQLSFVVGQDTSSVNKMNVAFSDFNLADGASKVDEVLGSEVLSRAVGNGSAVAGDLGAGLSIFVSDGTTSVSVDLADVRVAANNATLAASSATHANVATALQTKATANASFLLTIQADGTSGFKFIEKAGSGKTVTDAGDLAKYTGTGAVSFTFLGGVAGTGSGVMGESLSAYKSTLGGSAKNVDTSTTVGEIDVAIKGVAQARADFGAVINTLEHSVDNLNVAIQNTSSAKSAIMDADYAAETTELARTQILAQAATAMLSQANQQQQSVLALLK